MTLGRCPSARRSNSLGCSRPDLSVCCRSAPTCSSLLGRHSRRTHRLGTLLRSTFSCASWDILPWCAGSVGPTLEFDEVGRFGDSDPARDGGICRRGPRGAGEGGVAGKKREGPSRSPATFVVTTQRCEENAACVTVRRRRFTRQSSSDRKQNCDASNHQRTWSTTPCNIFPRGFWAGPFGG